MIFGKCKKMWKICFEIEDNAFPLISDCGICYELNLSADIPLKDNSVDYIFTDPPFGANIMYSELNFLPESWLRRN